MIGGRARGVLLHPRAPSVTAPASAGDEVLEHIPAIARKRRLDLGVLLPVLAALPIKWVDPERYASHEAESRRRLRGRDEDDWPVVALALELKSQRKLFATWTQDKDFEVSRLPILTTGQLLDYFEGRSTR
jgi:predicted nucleic acid-binding protein